MARYRVCVGAVWKNRKQCTKKQISQARALICYLAVRDLRISGADVARRMNIDRSSVSRAVRRVEADPALKNMRNTLLDKLYPED
jgi:predicted regulator of amino acid metabolism with ACT domain